ncbi:MAG: hypothetical protein HUU16_13165 [Candidatus Omnitrophica bacterium]|nr:hypothetical protein [bacterium]NUN97115.1 hypothetical protein [Candidatus Omnitrophota bacterium]
MKFAYADPPYLGLAKKTYGDVHPQAAEYDDPETHRVLIERLCNEYPDGWAMSCHTPSLRTILTLGPADVRVAAWCKPWAPFRPGVKTAHFAWEPIIYRGGRPFSERLHAHRDYTVTPMRLGKSRDSFGRGSKPVGLIQWILRDLLNANRDDEVDDLFPGSGGVAEAIRLWREQETLFEVPA